MLKLTDTVNAGKITASAKNVMLDIRLIVKIQKDVSSHDLLLILLPITFPFKYKNN